MPDFTLTHTYTRGCPQAVVTVTSGNQTQSAVVELTGCSTGDPELALDVTRVSNTGDDDDRTITVTGTGFASGTDGRIVLQDRATPPTEVVSVDVTADGQGGIAETAIIVPEGQETGTYDMTTTGAAGEAPAVAVTVVASPVPRHPHLVVSQQSIDIAGDDAARTITVEGHGLTASITGYVSVLSPAGKTLASTKVATDAAGSIPATEMVVPDGSPIGEYKVHANYRGVSVADAKFAVTSSKPPKLIVSDTDIFAGMTLDISGSGYPAMHDAVVGLYKDNGDSVTSVDVTTTEDGSLTGVVLPIPEDTAQGTYQLRAVSGDRTSPDIPITVEPRHSLILASRVHVNSAAVLTDEERTITVTGGAFPAGVSGVVELQSGRAGTDGTVIASTNVTTNSDGVFTDTHLVVPGDQERGNYHVVAKIGTETSNDTPVLVRYPQVTWTPKVIRKGTTISTSGSDFHPWPKMIVWLKGYPTGIWTYADSNGAPHERSITVTKPDAKQAIVYTTTSQRWIVEQPITVLPDMKLITDVTDIQAGGTVAVSGVGFAPSSNGTVTLVSEPGEEVATATVTTNDEGEFPNVQVAVPDDTAAGTYSLTAEVGGETSPGVDITVTSNGPTVTVAPKRIDSTAGDTDRTITVTGTGFPVDATNGDIKFSTSLHDELEGSTATASNGGFSHQLTVIDGLATGEYIITGELGGQSATTPLNVSKGDAPAPALSPDKTTVKASGVDAERTIAVTGTDFKNSSSGDVVIMSQGAPPHRVISILNIRTDADGALASTNITVPPNTTAGTYDLTTLGLCGVAVKIPVTVTE